MGLLLSREDRPGDIIEIYRAKGLNERDVDVLKRAHEIARFNYGNLRGDQTGETGLGKPRFLIAANRVANASNIKIPDSAILFPAYKKTPSIKIHQFTRILMEFVLEKRKLLLSRKTLFKIFF